MSDHTQIPGVSARRTFIAFYGIFVSFAHEYGYWRNFHIQFLEHVGLADLPKLAVWPVVAAAGALIIGSILAMATVRPIFPPGGGVHSPVGVVLNRHRVLIGLPLFLFGCLSFWLMKNNANWWVVGPAPIAWGLAIIFDINALSASVGITLPVYFDFIIIFLPCFAFGVGHRDALNIINGTDYAVGCDVRFGLRGVLSMRRSASQALRSCLLYTSDAADE